MSHRQETSSEAIPADELDTTDAAANTNGSRATDFRSGGGQTGTISVTIQPLINASGDKIAIHLVIIPYLKYGASLHATLEREKDYKLCLERNLAHPQVQQVHMLTTNHTDTQERFKDYTNNSKLVISEVESVESARDPWEYISKHLIHKMQRSLMLISILGKDLTR